MRTARPAECGHAKAPPSGSVDFAQGPIREAARSFRDHALYIAHDLIRKPVPTFRDHALALPVQHADQREQPAGGLEIAPPLALQALLQRSRAFVVDAAAAHVDGLDL